MKDHYNLITRQQTFRTPSNIIIITRDYVTDYYMATRYCGVNVITQRKGMDIS